MTKKLFILRISILEAKILSIGNANSTVRIQVANQKHYTSVKRNTDCPYFNETFVFELTTSLEELLDTHIILILIQPRSMCKMRKIIGEVLLDLSSVWVQPYHQFYHKWAVLASPDVKNPGPKGYLKLDLFITTKGEIHKIPNPAEEDENNDDIEGNLLLPLESTGDRQRVIFTINIYRAENLRIYDTKCNCKSKISNCFVKIWIAGRCMKTSEQKNTDFPVWNQKLVLYEMFPTLSQSIRIEIKDSKSELIAKHYLDFNMISHSNEINGFLPTFGPTFIHLYNQLGLYCGKLLLSIQTKTTNKQPGINFIDEADKINEETCWDTEKSLLFCMISEATLIDKVYANKPIAFELSFGCPQTSSDNAVTETVPKSASTYGNNYYYHLKYEDSKPCLYIKSTQQDVRYRMYNSNLLFKIAKSFQNYLQILEQYLQDEASISKINKSFSKTLSWLEVVCSHYLDVKKHSDSSKTTPLDKCRYRLCMEHVNNIKNFVKSISLKNFKKHYFKQLKIMHEKLEKMIEIPQDSWPDITVWMSSGRKKVGFCKIQARDICYSLIDEESGMFCSKLNDLFILPSACSKEFSFRSECKIACKLTVYFWLGLERHKCHCLESVKNFHQAKSKKSKENLPIKIPSFIHTTEGHLFECRAHIFQGRFRPGMDISGLTDSFVRISIGAYSLETEVMCQILDPKFDQTLVFENITVYGNIEFIKKNPPSIIVEVFDLDKNSFQSKIELIGRTLTWPIVKSLKDNYIIPKLEWIAIYKNNLFCGELLASFEFLEHGGDLSKIQTNNYIPPGVRPILVSYRAEILFWGIRNYENSKLDKPKISITFGEATLESDVLVNFKRNFNFLDTLKTADLELPEDEAYFPYLGIKLLDCGCFGCFTYKGIHVRALNFFTYKLFSELELNAKKIPVNEKNMTVINLEAVTSNSIKSYNNEILYKHHSFWEKIKHNYVLSLIVKTLHCKGKNKRKTRMTSEVDTETFDWWTKYLASTEKEHYIPTGKFKVYQSELERQPEFRSFNDYIRSFRIHIGKRTGDECLDEENVSGIFKGVIRIYRWPHNGQNNFTETGWNANQGTFTGFANNSPVNFTVRIYIIKGLCFRPKDSSGTSDIYFTVTLGSKTINDKKKGLLKQVDPVCPIFGKLYEMQGLFPKDYLLKISVWDWDLIGRDDLIGETKIDLEQRFYSKHRGQCGIANHYHSSGFNKWRDSKKPSQILTTLCQENQVEGPIFKDNSVTVGPLKFNLKNVVQIEHEAEETLSVIALRHWQKIPLVGCKLVPEHIETRSLFDPTQPGIEQGKLQMWVDIFPILDDFSLPPAVDIAPRKPIDYELRVIILNTEDVVLNDDLFFVGDKMSDIYIKGWLTDPKECQSTDIHYHSITGEGNFNWRFIFKFKYLSAENKIVMHKTDSLFSSKANIEIKIPCKLTLQVWDNDTLSPDDFLGNLVIDLLYFPRGSKDSKNCKLDIIKDDTPTVNLFKLKRAKGWWPFKMYNIETKQYDLVGKIEAEFVLLTEEDAKNYPAGLGRSAPDPLPEPQRPDSSFSWFKNPFKAIRFIICRYYKWRIITCIFFTMLIIFLLLFIYNMPAILESEIFAKLFGTVH